MNSVKKTLNTFRNNIILNTDSYKIGHYKQYPPNTDIVMSYIEARGSEIPDVDYTVFFGLQAFIAEYLMTPITMADVEQAKQFFEDHLGPNLFNYNGWKSIVEHHNGYLPLRIRAVEEGTVLPTHNVTVTVENTDSNCFWLTSYIETALLRAVWYPTTVATISHRAKALISQALIKTSDNADGLNFKLHDFGARGVSSFESAALGGMAHLVNFQGSDTIAGVLAANTYYNAEMAGFSIPAAEHSTITAWGRDHEVDAFRNMLKQFQTPLIAVVSDSYDIYNAVEHLWGETLRQDVIDGDSIIVIRPDSGNPNVVVPAILRMLNDKFGSKINSKGYKVLNHVRVIQGDGMNIESIPILLDAVTMAGFSTDNIAMGMGGGLLQKLDRDTFKFAMKACAVAINGDWVDVYKDPITDHDKQSKRGKQMLYQNKQTGMFVTARDRDVLDGYKKALHTVYENGHMYNKILFDTIRVNAMFGV